MPAQVLIYGVLLNVLGHALKLAQEGEILLRVLLSVLSYHHHQVEVVGAQGNIVEGIHIDQETLHPATDRLV